ncbi:hypothetical protein [Desulfoferrobacter suflitae]|uniref:hypothetical protein n=1 Tax=Desulfoferrobacter suflitae TaxID=2865782 RepID=UPI0021642FA2|nr:hypothetical protein [Desulfoferrobacter suflitae]MCK8604356.1 hypothetical protein [Desulfoferrobacter suflitae]
MFLTDADTDAIEFAQDTSQAESSKISQSCRAPVVNGLWLCHLPIQKCKGIGSNSLEHATAFNFFGQGGNNGLAIQQHTEVFFCNGDDLGNVEGLSSRWSTSWTTSI